MTYLDYAASAPLRTQAKEAMTDAMEVLGNPSSRHTAGTNAKALLEESRRTVAECFCCEPSEILFTSGGTESNAIAINGRTGKCILSPMEHPSVSGNLLHGELLAVGKDGVVSVQDAMERIDRETSFVSVQYANNELGTIQPIREIGTVCRSVGAIFHTDAVQAAGHLPIRLSSLPVDLLSLSAHKFGGPVGAGVLYRKTGTPLSPIAYGGGQEQNLRPGTESVVLATGLSVALKVSLIEAERENSRVALLRDALEQILVTMGGISTTKAERLPGHLHIRFPGEDGEAMLHALDLMGFCVSAGSACHSGERLVSKTLSAIGFTPEDAACSLRISLGRKTTREDVLRFAEAVRKLICIK